MSHHSGTDSALAVSGTVRAGGAGRLRPRAFPRLGICGPFALGFLVVGPVVAGRIPVRVDRAMESPRDGGVVARVRLWRVLRLAIAVVHNNRVCRGVPWEGHFDFWQNKAREIIPERSRYENFQVGP